jgi:hypothetical protein
LVNENINPAQMGRKRAASGVGSGPVPDGLCHGFDGRNFRLLLLGWLIEGGIKLCHRQPGFERQQFQLGGMKLRDAVGLRCEPREGIKPPLLLENGNAARLFADVLLLIGDDL